MLKSAKMRAEEQFKAIQKKGKESLKQKDKAQLETAKQVARLRALRLAKEAADKEAADAEQTATEDESSPRLPRAHRSQT